jgi:hypothetical protein
MTTDVARRDPGTGRFAPGTPKTGGRGPGVVNKDRRLSIDRIMSTADPLDFLCRVVRGDELDGVTPTLLDRIAAAKVLAAKVMPDLKSISVDDGGNMVTVLLQLGQRSD